jgi:outer membrane protein insertion porin family
MKYHRMLFAFLSLFLIHSVSLAATFMQQDSQSQEKREASQRANSAEDGNKAIPGMEDLPFLGRSIVGIEFRGNKVFTSDRLLSHFKYLKLNKPLRPGFRELVQGELDRLRVLLYVDNGYLQARFHEPEFENTLNGVKITIPIEEGVLYRAGEIEIKDAKLFSPDEIRETIGLKKGEVIKGISVISKGIDLLKQKYQERGYVQVDVYFQPEFYAPAPDTNEAIADLKFIFEEGEVYTIGKISFTGSGAFNDELLRSKLSIKEGDVYNRTLFEKSLLRLNRLGIFEMVKEEDVGLNTNEKTKLVEMIFLLTRKQEQ